MCDTDQNAAALVLTEKPPGTLDPEGVDRELLSAVPQAVISRLRSIKANYAAENAREAYDKWMLEESERVEPWIMCVAPFLTVVDLSGWASLKHGVLISILKLCGQYLTELVLPKLETVVLGPNYLASKAKVPVITPHCTGSTISESLALCPKLERFVAFGWRDEEAVFGFKAFANSLSHCHNLRHLELSCIVENEDLLSFADAPCAHNMLEHLIFCDNDSDNTTEQWSLENETKVLSALESKFSALKTLSLPRNLPLSRKSLEDGLVQRCFPMLQDLHFSIGKDWMHFNGNGDGDTDEDVLLSDLCISHSTATAEHDGDGLSPMPMPEYEYECDSELVSGADVASWSTLFSPEDNTSTGREGEGDGEVWMGMKCLKSLSVSAIHCSFSALICILNALPSPSHSHVYVSVSVPYSCEMRYFDGKKLLDISIAGVRSASAESASMTRTRTVSFHLCDLPCDNCRVIRNFVGGGETKGKSSLNLNAIEDSYPSAIPIL